MNSTLNETYHDLEYWFLMVGQSWIFDYLYVYSLVPFFLIAFGISLLGYLILLKKEFQIGSFYQYMRAYILNGMFLFAILTTTFIPLTKSVFKFTNTYEAIFFGCFFQRPVQYIFYTNSALIETCIVVERLLYFLPARYRRIKMLGFKKFSFFLIIISTVINLPNFFMAYPTSMDVKLDRNTTFRIYYWGSTDFSRTTTAFVLLALMYLIRDILILLVKIVLNIKLISMVRGYIHRIKMEKLAFAQKISSGKELHNNKVLDKPINASGYISKTDRNQTYIALSMCIFSLFNHLFNILALLLYFSKRIDLAGIALYLSLISLGLNHISNFIALYKFKYLFRVELKKSFKIASSSSLKSSNKTLA